jgi:hypothetical protein
MKNVKNLNFMITFDYKIGFFMHTSYFTQILMGFRVS